MRCLLVDAEGGRVVSAARPWILAPAPNAGFFAFDLDIGRCWRLVREVVADAMGQAGLRSDDIVGLAATGMRFATVLVDGDGETPFAVPNHDARSAAESIRLADELGAELNARTGHWPAPIFLAARLLWLDANAPGTLAQASRAVGLSDWLGLKLTGVAAADVSQAAETLLFDLAAGDWAWDLISRLGLPARLFAPLRAPGTLLGGLTEDAAAALGLRPGTPVAVGGADTQCGLLGAGVVKPGQLAIVAGSTTPLQLVTDQPHVDASGRCWAGRHVVPGLGILESNAGAMGDTLEWFAGILNPDAPDPVAHFCAEAAMAEPGAGGVVSSLGAQVMDARDIMALPIGTVSLTHLDLRPDDTSDHGAAGGAALGGGETGRGQGRAARGRRNLARAVLEGMAFAIKANAAQLRDAAASAGTAGAQDSASTETHIVGGLTRNHWWTQVVCDVLESPLVVASAGEASALGAAVCAGVAAGVFPDLAAGASTLARTRRLEPDPARTRGYEEMYEQWTRLREVRAPADKLASGMILQGMMDATQVDLDGRGGPAGAGGRPAEPGRPSILRRRLRILATADLDNAALAELRQLGDVAHEGYREALRLLTGDDLVETLGGCDVFITEVDIVDAEALARLPDLRVIAVCRGQAVNVDLAACTALGIPVLSAPGRNAEAVADLALAFMLVLERKLAAANAFLRAPGGEAGDLGRMGQAHDELLGHELWGKTVGLVGFGAVGRAVARRLRPFGARVLVCDPYVNPDDVRLADGEPAGLDELLAASDIVSLHAPLTDESRVLINAGSLARMKPGAFLVNTARAGLVDEDALYDALRSGRLGGAALDVFAIEPPAADDPLLGLPNVIATPHVGGNTVEVGAHQGRICAADLRRMAAGQAPRHTLNPEAFAGFSWDAPRRRLDAATLAALAATAGPAVTDLQQSAAGRQAEAGLAAASTPAGGGATTTITPAPPDAAAATGPAAQMQNVLRLFVERAGTDEALRAFAARHRVGSHYAVSDLDLEFFIGFAEGKVLSGLGPPPERADVRLKTKGEVLDAILTGRLNGNKAAMTGRLSFSGDVRLAMGMQRVQKDFIRLYSAARAEAGGIDFSAPAATQPAQTAAPAPPQTAPAASAPAAAAIAPPPGPITGSAGAAVIPGPAAPFASGLTLTALEARAELTRVTEELFAAQLLTATGGNVSVRIPGADELWITPSQLYKGGLAPDVMVRVGLDGNAVDADAPAPSSERQLHCAIYRARLDVEAVIHAHAAYATILGMSGIPFTPVTTEAAFFGDIPRVPFIMPGSEELAAAAKDALGDGSAVLLQNHGLIVAASSLRQAANATEVIERVSHLIWSCHVAGRPAPPLPDDMLAMLREIGRMMA